MAGKNKAVFGLYKSVVQAEETVNRLVAAGFSNDDISVLLPDNESTRKFAHKKDTKAPEGTTAGVAAGGGLIGALVGMGIPEYEAKRYEGRIKEGGVLLSAHCDTSEEITRAKEILKQTGAEDIASSGEGSADYPAAATQTGKL
jgi:hypothetical protein